MRNPSGRDNAFEESEISLLDILRFFKSVWKTIIIAVFAGFAVSIAYLLITPSKYEAVAQISMAQIGGAKLGNALGIVVEEPALLIARMSSPTSFSLEAKAACGLQDEINSAQSLSSLVKIMVPKGVVNMVELRTVGPSPQLAQECAQEVFNLIKNTQAEFAAPYIEAIKIKLADAEERLNKARVLILNADRSGSAGSVDYLLARDEIRYFLDEVTVLKDVISISKARVTRLIAPIYVGKAPIAPKKRVVLTYGLFGGLLLGLLIALARQMIVKFKSEMQMGCNE